VALAIGSPKKKKVFSLLFPLFPLKKEISLKNSIFRLLFREVRDKKYSAFFGTDSALGLPFPTPTPTPTPTLPLLCCY